MPILRNNFFYNHLTFDSMYAAFLRARKDKISRYDVMEFEYELERNIVKLVEEIKLGTYKIGNYRKFLVYEPKKREIKALPFRDRVVHQWFVYEFIIPISVPRFIHDSYACIKNKGTHAAVNRLKYFMRKARLDYGEFYILKMDIKKFFYSIQPDILMSLLKKIYKDKRFLRLCETLIYESDTEVGIPIGNYTSQYFANIYLNELDQYIKHNLKVKYYIRYMDDFILLVKDKKDAKRKFDLIKNFLKKELKLDLNHKSKYYPSKMGVDFCGYRIFHTHILVRNRSKKKMKQRINQWNYLYKKDELNMQEVQRSFNSWKAHIKHADSYNLYNRYTKKCEFDIT